MSENSFIRALKTVTNYQFSSLSTQNIKDKKRRVIMSVIMEKLQQKEKMTDLMARFVSLVSYKTS